MLQNNSDRKNSVCENAIKIEIEKKKNILFGSIIGSVQNCRLTKFKKVSFFLSKWIETSIYMNVHAYVYDVWIEDSIRNRKQKEKKKKFS